MWSVLIGSILWLTNVAFNFVAKDYRAFCINLLYVICLFTLGGATFRQERDIVQGMIGALMMISVIGNVNVLSEALDISVPSRALWQMIVGAVLTVVLFFNHFMITRKCCSSKTMQKRKSIHVPHSHITPRSMITSISTSLCRIFPPGLLGSGMLSSISSISLSNESSFAFDHLQSFWQIGNLYNQCLHFGAHFK